MQTISKIKFPSGNTYEIKDSYARQLLAGGLKYVVCFDGTAEPVVANIPAGVKVTYEETVYTGTKSAETAEALTFYLVKSSTQVGENDVYDEYAAIGDTGSKFWEKLGDTRLDLSNLGALAYKDEVILNTGSGDVVLGEDTTFTNGSSNVSFAAGSGSDFVTGYNNDAVAPSFSEGAYTPASLGNGFVSNGTAPSFSEGAFTPASIKAGFVSNGTAPSFSEGAFTPAEIKSGFVTAGQAASYSHSGFSGGSLGNATKSSFATEGLVASVGTGDDAETLVLTAAGKSQAVTEQGSFTPAVYGTDTFDGGTPTAIDTSKFSGGSKAADTFSAGTMTTVDTTKFDGGSKAADTFDAGTMTTVDVSKFNGGSKAADTFSAGTPATLAKAKAITASDTGTAAAQTITVGTNDKVTVAKKSDLSVSVQ